jgi:hypothetical protein
VRARQDAGAKLAIVYPNGVIGPDDPGLSEAVRAFRGFTRATLATSGGLASVDVRDLALLCARLLETERSGRFVLGGQFHSWDELVAELEALLGREIRRVRAPGWLLRAGGALLDALRAARAGRAPHGTARSGRVGASAMITGEAMAYATQMRALPNDPVLGELGVTLRPLRETYQATLASLSARRHPREPVRPVTGSRIPGSEDAMDLGGTHAARFDIRGEKPRAARADHPDRRRCSRRGGNFCGPLVVGSHGPGGRIRDRGFAQQRPVCGREARHDDVDARRRCDRRDRSRARRGVRRRGRDGNAVDAVGSDPVRRGGASAASAASSAPASSAPASAAR